MNDLMKYLFLRLLNERGDTLNDMLYNSGSGPLQNAIPSWWTERLRADAIRHAFWGKRFEGKEGSRKPIIINEDFTKKPGDTIKFNCVSQLFSAGVTGESVLQGNEDQLALSQFTLTIDWLRNAIAYTKSLEKRVNFNIAQTIRTELSDWLARKMDYDMFNSIISNATNTIYAGAATTQLGLGTNDHFGTEEIDRLKLALQRTAIPIRQDGEDGQEEYYGCVISEVDEYWLKGDPVWAQAQRDAAPRSKENNLFIGALGMYNGIIIYTHKGKKSGNNIQGTPLRPEVRLTVAAGSGDSTLTFDVVGTKKNLGLMFASSGTNYLRVDSEEISYTSITAGTLSGTTYQFAGCSRGFNGTTAATHAIGALVTQRNVSTIVGFGAEIAVRGWGMKPVPITQGYDYKFPDGSSFENGLGIAAVYGQSVIQNSAGSAVNMLIMKAYADNPISV
jgi:N4-gp56 family major capsid protein